MTPIQALDPFQYLVIDTVTGTIVDVGVLRLVPTPRDGDILDAIVTDSASAAEYASNHGIPLYVEDGDLTN